MVANKQTRIKQAKAYVKSKIWKQFWKQKLYELILIPLAGLSLWKVPSWIGWGIINLFNIDPATSTWFCKEETYRVCIGVSESQIWLWGVVFLLIPIFLIGVNWQYAKNKLQDEATKKYDLYYSELEDD